MDEQRLRELLEKDIDDRLTDAEREDLLRELRASASARRAYWDAVEQHVLIGAILSESRGRDLASLEIDDNVGAETIPAGKSHRSRRWIGALSVAAACALIGAAIWLLRPAEPTPVATILTMSGDVQVDDASGKATAVEQGRPLFAGQVLRVGDDESRAEIQFADGTQFTMQPGSMVRLAAPAKNQVKQIHLQSGAVNVTSAAGSSGLVVTTDHAKIVSSATRMRVYREENASRVELEEGTAHLESNKGAAVDVAEGSYVLATDREPMVPHQLSPAHWRLRHTFVRTGDAVAFSSDGSTDSGRIVTSHFSRVGFKTWNALNGSMIAAGKGFGQRTHALAFLGDDSAAAICLDGSAVHWKFGEQPVVTKLRDKDLRHASMSVDGRWIAQSTRSDVVAWEVDPSNGRFSQRYTLTNQRPSRVAICSGPKIAISMWSGEIVLADVATSEILARHKLSRTPTPLALSPDGRYLAAYAAGDGLVLFDETTGVQRPLWAGQGARVSSLNFSRDNKVVLAGLEDGTVRAWSVSDGQSLFVLEAGYGGSNVSAVTMSPDRSLLATIGDNDCVKIWERPTP